MKTLIETKTGKVVNAGDVITLDGTAHILTDFDVPGLIGRGVLTFACVDVPSKKDDTKAAPEVSKTDIPDIGTDNDIDQPKGFIPMFDPQSLNLKKVLLTWGIRMGLQTEDEVLQYASLIKAATPVGFLGIVLRELADEFNMYDTYQSHEWAFDYANCQIVKVDPHQMLYPENVVMFDSHQVLENALLICKELIDEICPNGE